MAHDKNPRISRKSRVILTVTIIASFLLALQSTHLTHLHMRHPLIILENKMEDLREKGIPLKDAHVDDTLGCLVVEFKDMEREYVESVRETVGYEHPILFRELEENKVLIGHPPAPILDICRVLNSLFESGEYYGQYSIDFERGLLHLILRDLGQGEIDRITRIVGDEVPIEFEELAWMDRLYVGRPSHDIDYLENASWLLSELGESINSAISGTGVSEETGYLKISLYKHGCYPYTISAIREVLGPETPAFFVFRPWEIPQEWNQTSPSSLLKDFSSIFDLPDLGYEITQQDEDTASAYVNFMVDGDHIPFMSLELHRINSTWDFELWSRCRAPSPSRQIEIVGYLLKQYEIFWKIFPVVKNPGRNTALVSFVTVEMENSTHTFINTYLTAGMDLTNGLIGPNEYELINPRFSWEYWRIKQTGELCPVHRDSIGGETFRITIVLKDGKKNILAQRTFEHTFS